MRGPLFLMALAAAMFVASGAPAKAPAPRAAARDWSRVVVATSEGGFRMGSPAAKVQLVEYGSLACSHCRHFEQTGYAPLVRNYVKTGRVSYEFRNFLLNGPDLAVSLLTRCAGARQFFPMANYVFATQPQWEKKFEDLSKADAAALQALPDEQRIARFAVIGGMLPIAARYGVNAARARQCLTDTKGIAALIGITAQAQSQGITHTPTFLINGKESEAAGWDKLEPELKSALGG